MKGITIWAIATSAFALPAVAHHSDAALDLKTTMTFEGTVTEYTLRNPHSYFVVETVNETRETVSWEVQMGSALSMSRRGWTSDTLSLGDHVVVGVHPARDGRAYGLIESLVKEGLPISYERLRTSAAGARTTTLAGVWTTDLKSLGPDYPDGLDQLMARELTLTAKAQAAVEAFDQNSLENPELSCITKPTPGGLVYTDRYPMEIDLIDEDEIVMIRVQYFDQERTVYMDGRGHPPADIRTHEGHSIGSWEGHVLVVDTTNFEDDRSPYQNGTPSGTQKHVVERYWLNEGGTSMTLQFTLEDPEYIVGSMTHTRELRYSPQIEITPFNCDLEATRRYLPNL
jgi:hypothetical protein